MSPEKEPQQGSSSLSIQTLVISSLAAVAAAIVVPMFWERGSLLATAITPIIVAIVSEALNRPAKVITKVTPKVVPRRTATGAALRSEQPTGVGARGGGPEQLPPRRDDPFGLYEQERPRRRFPWKLAIVTGLLAAVIGATVVTASELALFGHQVGNTHRSTGLLGGKSSKSTATPTATPTATEDATKKATETATPTETESATPTPSVTPSATATATVAPQQATPTATAPTEATPVPTATP